jgi:hypothetical protein
MTHLSRCARIEKTIITVATRRFAGYKYLLHLALRTISQFSFPFYLLLGFFSLALY